MPDGWEWELTDQVLQDLRSLDGYAQNRIVSKLDSIVADEWREPADFLETLVGARSCIPGSGVENWSSARGETTQSHSSFPVEPIFRPDVVARDPGVLVEFRLADRDVQLKSPRLRDVSQIPVATEGLGWARTVLTLAAPHAGTTETDGKYVS